MKKTVPLSLALALLLSLLFSLSACRKPSDSNHTETDTERFEKLYYGHDIEKVLTRHTSSLLETNLFFNDEKVSTDYLYADANTHCMISPTGVSYLNSRTQSVMTAGEREGGFLTYICDTDDTYREWFEGEYSEFSAKPLGEETLYDTEEKDGSFIAYTELKDAEALKNTVSKLFYFGDKKPAICFHANTPI